MGLFSTVITVKVGGGGNMFSLCRMMRCVPEAVSLLQVTERTSGPLRAPAVSNRAMGGFVNAQTASPILSSVMD